MPPTAVDLEPEASHRTDEIFLAPAPAGPSRLDAVDGLRGVAVAAVIAFHFGVGGLQGGFLGVDLFFVISGFVITRLLMVERDRHGGVALRRFRERRVRRLLPSVLAVVGVVAVWTLVAPSLVDRTVRRQGYAALVYGSNWYNVFARVGYWDPKLDTSPLNHLWSLAIEEQFYVVWPLVVAVVLAAAGTRWRPALLRVAGCLAAASAVAQVVLARESGTDRAYFGSDTRAIAILLGVIVALLVVQVDDGRAVERLGPGRRARGPADGWVWLAAGSAIAALLWVGRSARVEDPALYRGPLLLASFAGAVLVATVALAPTHRVGTALAARPLVAIGHRSYGLYLWHVPILLLLDEAATGWTGAPLLGVRLVALVVVSELCRRFVEEPVRHAESLTGRRLVLAMGVPVLLVAGLLSQIDDPPARDAEGAGSGAAAGFPASGGVPAEGNTVLVVGDSWGAGLGRALGRVSDRSVHVANGAVGGCGIADPTEYRVAGQGDVPIPEACEGWQHRWKDLVSRLEPAAAVLEVGNWDQAMGRFDGSWMRPCDGDFDVRYGRKLDEAIEILGSRGARVFVMDVRDGDGDTLRRVSDCMNDTIRAAWKRHPDVVPLRLGDRLCPGHHGCPARLDGKVVYDETGHLAPAWQERIARWALAEVRRRVSLEASPADRADELAEALPSVGEVDSLAGTAVVRAPARSGVEILDAMVGRPAPEGRAGAVAEIVGVEGMGRGVLFRAVAAETTDDAAADALAMTLAVPALDAGLVPVTRDHLTTTYVRRDGAPPGPHQQVLLVVRRVDRVLVVEVEGDAVGTDPQLAAVADALTVRLDSVRPPG